MKMMKSLLLGTAAGLVAMTGAQAADLPVKAKPVEYVKICSLYGAGFYYMPGTDVCLKIGGYMRQEISYGADNGMTANGPFNSSSGRYNRVDSAPYQMRSRGYLTADARQQSEYGTIRGYIAIGTLYDSSGGGGVTLNNPSGGNAGGTIGFNSNRNFVQFAGFTMGVAVSMFDFYSVASSAYWGNYAFSDTGDGGWKIFAYTAQFGNGVSATLSAEEPRRSGVAETSIITPASWVPGVSPAMDNKGVATPDFVGNLRVDGTWGAAQIMAALHQVGAGYYTNLATFAGAVPNGHPSDVWGYALGAGLKLNLPMIAPGDWFQIQGTYAHGASRYVFHQHAQTSYAAIQGNNIAYGWTTDGVFTGATATSAGADGIDLTTAWNINASIEHFWNPKWQTSVYGVYAAVRYTAAANTNLCNGMTNSFAAIAATSQWSLISGTCNNDWETWGVGSRTQWNINKLTYLGVDVMYQKLQSASGGASYTMNNVVGAQPALRYFINDIDNWQVRFRAHRDFMF